MTSNDQKTLTKKSDFCGGKEKKKTIRKCGEKALGLPIQPAFVIFSTLPAIDDLLDVDITPSLVFLQSKCIKAFKVAIRSLHIKE